MEIRLLGPVEIRDGDRVVDCGSPQQRLVLAVLAVSVGQPVTAEALIDRVWDEAPPAGARRTLHVYVAGLRRLLPGGALVRRSGGYVLEANPDRVDVHRFLARPRDAIELWRGEPLAGLPGEWAERTRQAWWNRYVEGVLDWAGDTDPDLVVGPLRELAERYPLTEPLAAALVRALHAVGRDDEALEWYERVRSRLADELGTDPGAELQEAYRAVRSGSPVPAQLPGDVYGFAGRVEALAVLDKLLTGTVVISAVSGTAGVGKTALAVHWAHRVAGAFPDGQLYVNLRGFDPGGQVMTPAEAVRGFLDALGVAPERVPASFDAQIDLYRGLLARKRLLVVLDNARDAEQVRPLLPGTPTALTMITSRNRLADLDAAVPVNLDVLSTVESRDLLARRLTAERLSAEPDVLDEIIARCARLPLALTIVAARAQVTGLRLAALAAELGRAGERLDALDTGDPASQVRAVFSWSYQALSPAAGRLFRLLGLHPGPDISVPAAASLAGLALPEARDLLAGLERTNLVVEQVPGRYTFHDLLRAYAAELAESVEPAGERREAVRRMLDHYVYSGYGASLVLFPTRGSFGLTTPGPGVAAEQPPADQAQALAWFGAEHAILIRLIDSATEHGLDVYVLRLAWIMHDYLDRQGHWHDSRETKRAAVAVAVRTGDSLGEAHMRRLIAGAYIRLARYDEARAELEPALLLYRQAGEVANEGHAEHSLGFLAEAQGRPAEALAHSYRALELHRAGDNRTGVGSAYAAVGWYHALLGQYEEALAACEQALEISRALDHRIAIGAISHSLGYIHRKRGRHAESLDAYRRALLVFREAGDRQYEADTLTELGEVHQQAGDPGGARDAWEQALQIFTELDHAGIQTVRGKLAALDQAGSLDASRPRPGRIADEG
jgi:DNA-binding SARP family transcriptional activator/tetratricopeptide (TPR) repeat protein